MGSERTKHTIQELIDEGIITAHKDGNYGSMYPRQSEFGDTGILFLTAKLISDQGFIDFRSAPRLSYEKAKKLTFGYIESRDVLLSHNATVGRVAITPKLTEPVLVGTSLTYFRTDHERLLPEYLAAYLSGVDFQNELKAVMGLSTRNQVPITTQRKLEIVIPPITEQKQIVRILGSLDDKIELNRKMNATLEGMAQALFKSWFVDFDPVIDNALVVGNPIPDELAQRAEIRRQALADGTANREAARLFPAAFQHTESMGWIPEGWEVRAVSNAISINPSTKLKKGEVAPFADMKALPTSGYAIDGVFEKEYSGGAKFKNGDVLLARITPCLENGKTGIVDFLTDSDPVGFGSTEFIVLRSKGDLSTAFIACLARDSNFRKHCVQSMIGSSGRQRVHNSCFESYYLALPKNRDVVAKFSGLAVPAFTKAEKQSNENMTLGQLRDTILPKLISGELKVHNSHQ